MLASVCLSHFQPKLVVKGIVCRIKDIARYSTLTRSYLDCYKIMGQLASGGAADAVLVGSLMTH